VIFGSMAVVDAAGCVLAHSVKLPDGVLRKGAVLTATDLSRLQAAGHSQVVVARLAAGDVPEDMAAMRVAGAFDGASIEIGAAATGRVNIHARGAGLLMLDAERVHAANRVHEGITIATLHPDSPVAGGQMLATIKIIPYAVPADAVDEVLRVLRDADPALRVAPWRAVRAALVMTHITGTTDAVLAKMRAAVVERLQPLHGALIAEEVVTHDEPSLAAALQRLADAVDRPELLLVSGIAATVDRNDVVPAAVRRAGGMVLHAGMPVDPGNLLLLAELPWSQGVLPVIGIPTCARSPKLNGFDFVLRRIAAGETVAPSDIQAMGVGGLLTEIETRPMPRESRRRGGP
jgi:molybdenum cofactor cytidylyltransferase